MRNKFKHLLSISTVVFFIVLALASATGKNVNITKESKLIPPDFVPMKETLLVVVNMIPNGNVTKRVKSAFKDYKAPYVLVKAKEWSAYDQEKYKFVFYLTYNPSNYRDEKGRLGSGTLSGVMKDRNTGIEYKSAGVPDFGHLLKNYVKSLNALTE